MQLWHAYLTERSAALRGLPITDPAYNAMNNTYKRALVQMHKMPRIWLMYLELLISQCYITQARHAFDEALMALSITQHDRIWQVYLVRKILQTLMHLL